MILHILMFIASCGLIFFAGKKLIEALKGIAGFLKLREFVVAFFVMAFAATLPNFFVGITSAIHKIPQLSFGDIVGGNLIDLTVTMGLAVLIANGLPVKSKLVQTSALFTIVIAILPMFLILDGVLGREDGVVLILFFFFYVFWLFSKKERFSDVCDENGNHPIVKSFFDFFKNIGRAILGAFLLLIASQGIVWSASFFAENLNIPIILVGIFIVSVGNCLPEIIFSIASAKEKHSWLLLGNLMGSIIIPTSLTLGIVAIIHPIEIANQMTLTIARLFLLTAALSFFFAIRSGHNINKKEAIFLISLYAIFILVEIFLH